MAMQSQDIIKRSATNSITPPPQARDIERAVNLVYGGVLLWLVLLLFWMLFYA